jgi:hypothetical protein
LPSPKKDEDFPPAALSSAESNKAEFVEAINGRRILHSPNKEFKPDAAKQMSPPDVSQGLSLSARAALIECHVPSTNGCEVFAACVSSAVDVDKIPLLEEAASETASPEAEYSLIVFSATIQFKKRVLVLKGLFSSGGE